MTTINLKDFYYWYTQDQFIEVSDEIAEVFVADARHEMAYQRRLSRHKAQYSLDCDDGIEYSACLHEPTPQELLERMAFDTSLPQEERIALFLQAVENPYCFCIGGIGVKIEFAESGPSLQDILTDFLLR